MATRAEQFETVIIGGGQAGLAAAYQLKKRGRSARRARRERAHRRPVAPALALASVVHTGEIRRATGDAVPGAPKLVPQHRRDGRLPRGLHDAVRASRPKRCPCRRPVEGRGTVRRRLPAISASRRTTSSWPPASCKCRSCPTSRPRSIRRSPSSTRATIEAPRNCRRAPFSWSAPPTPAETSPSKSRPTTRRCCLEGTRVSFPSRSRVDGRAWGCQ